MELAYIWIGENKTGFIKNQGFNFLPDYRFELKYLEDKDTYLLDCTRNADYPNVWKRGNLSGLTAVVGENGTGKTSLMKCLLAPINDGNVLRVYRCAETFHVWHQLDRKVDCWAEGIQVNPEQGVRQLPLYMTNAHGRGSDEMLDYFTVFSPDSDIRYHFGAGMRYMSGEKMPEKFVDVYGKTDRIDFSKLAIIHYYHHQFQKANGREHQTQESFLKVNSALTVGFSRNHENIISRLLLRCKDDLDDSRKIPLREFRKALRESRFFLERLWLVLIAEVCYIADLWPYLDDIWPYLDEYRIVSIKKRVFGLLDSTLSAEEADSRLVNYYRNAIKEIAALTVALKSVDLPAGQTADSMVLSYAQHPAAYVEFCKLISGLLSESDSFLLRNLSIDLSELSSGEWAMQNICAWLLIASNSVMRQSIMKEKNILLLLDEVDLYMHPEWQRKFLNFLSKELALQFPEYQIQIIITTHSPLVLSDIPSRNIIYLGRKRDQCTVDGGPETGETFGANIFTLLKDSFYLERSLGEFAYTRIREAIEDLQALKNWGNPDAGEKQRELEKSVTYDGHRDKCKAYQQLIGIIGEPVVRGSLQRLYAELFPETQDTRFEKRLTDIRHMLKTMAADERERCMAELDQVLARMKESRE